jgi:signal transduction histidine kinase
VVTLAEELGDITAADAKERRDGLNRSISEFQHHMLLLRLLGTGIAIGIGIIATIRVFRLERAAAAERARIEEAESQMRKLSQQLVNAQEQERRHLSRELHDDIGQRMTALRFGLSDLEQHCTAPTPPFSDALNGCRSILEGSIEAIRGIAMGLRPAMLDDLGLAAAIEWHAREFSRKFNVPVTVDVPSVKGDCPEPQRTAVYRVAQEALTNCARHARANMIRVELSRISDSLRLSVTDDGVGIAAGHDDRRGFGLIGMEERIREVGGSLFIQSAPGQGTTVTLQVPIPR